MRKGIVFVISVLIILFVFSLFSLLLPSRIVIGNQATIIAPVEKVKDQVVHFNNWHNWYDAFADSSVSKTYLSPDSSAIELTDGTKKVVLKRLPEAGDTIYVELSSSSASKVIYQFVFINREDVHSNLMLNVIVYLKWYPWEKIKGLFMHKMAESFYESLVERIKMAAENS